MATESPLKMMKSAFYFTLSSFHSQDIYVFVLTFKIYDVTTWLKTVAIHIIRHQTMKFGQLIKYKAGHVFFFFFWNIIHKMLWRNFS